MREFLMRIASAASLTASLVRIIRERARERFFRERDASAIRSSPAYRNARHDSLYMVSAIQLAFESRYIKRSLARALLIVISVLMCSCGAPSVANRAPLSPEDFCWLINDVGLSAASEHVGGVAQDPDTELFRSLLVTYIAWAEARHIHLTGEWYWSRLGEFRRHRGEIIRQAHFVDGTFQESI
jgi:hypothetical protein